jgi:hypothetical protein
MNPIENVWGITKGKLQRTKITNKEQLVTEVRKIWESDKIKAKCVKAIRSTPNRLAEIQLNKGFHTKYSVNYSVGKYCISSRSLFTFE